MTILLDVNVLVYAFKRDEGAHERYHQWLTETVNVGVEAIALSESSVSGFVRIVTNPRIYERPAPAATAVAFVEALLASERAQWLPPTSATWRRFADIVGDDHQVRGNLVPDAWLAALALSHRCRLATADRGMARFSGLRWFDPATSP